MPQLKLETLIEASERAWTNKSHWDELVRECFEFAMPDRNPYHYNGTGRPQGAHGTKGKDKNSRRVYDSTLQTDTIKIANRIQYELFPIGHQWATFQPGAFVQDQAKEQARGSLHGLQEVVFTAISFSNFDLSISEWLLELIVAGTAVMHVTPGDDDNPVIYQCVSQSHVALREGAMGKIDLISRKHKMRLTLVEQTWRDAKIDITEDERKDDPELDIIDVCYFDARENVWFYDVVITGGLKAKTKEHRIVERSYEICPWIITRWNKAAEEVQGRSLVMQALPDARVLSAVKAYILKQAALSIGGVFLGRNDGILNPNTVRIAPGAVIPVRATGGQAGASLTPLPVGGDMNLADLVIKDLVNSIHKIMMNDGMPDVSEGVRTATELIERMKELQQSLGAPFARILKEGIIPILEATIAVLSEAGVIPELDGRKIKLNSGQIEVRFASPLVQGQSVREVEAARQAMMITAEAAGEEAVGLNFKIEDFGAFVAEKLGVVPDLVRIRSEREKLQKEAAQVMAMQANGQPSVGGTGGVIPQQQQMAGSVPLAA